MQVSFKFLLNIWDNYNIFAITYAPIIYDYYNYNYKLLNVTNTTDKLIIKIIVATDESTLLMM